MNGCTFVLPQPHRWPFGVQGVATCRAFQMQLRVLQERFYWRSTEHETISAFISASIDWHSREASSPLSDQDPCISRAEVVFVLNGMHQGAGKTPLVLEGSHSVARHHDSSVNHEDSAPLGSEHPKRQLRALVQVAMAMLHLSTSELLESGD